MAVTYKPEISMMEDSKKVNPTDSKSTIGNLDGRLNAQVSNESAKLVAKTKQLVKQTSEITQTCNDVLKKVHKHRAEHEF